MAKIESKAEGEVTRGTGSGMSQSASGESDEALQTEQFKGNSTKTTFQYKSFSIVSK